MSCGYIASFAIKPSISARPHLRVPRPHLRVPRPHLRVPRPHLRVGGIPCVTDPESRKHYLQEVLTDGTCSYAHTGDFHPVMHYFLQTERAHMHIREISIPLCTTFYRRNVLICTFGRFPSRYALKLTFYWMWRLQNTHQSVCHP